MQSYEDIFYRLPTITTARLVLRSARMADAQDIYEYSRDPLVARHVLWEPHSTIHQTRAYIRYLIKQYRSGLPATFVIELRKERKVIGTIGFMWLHKENRSAEVGYSLNRNYWNQGIMTEALRAMISFGFDVLNLNRIEAQHESDNPASGHVMARANMRHEGHLRDRLYNKGRFVDVDLYAILRQDERQSG